MAKKFQLQVNTRVGIFQVSFDSVEELKESLDTIDLKKVLAEASEKFGKLQVIVPRRPKPGFEDIYRFTEEGFVELLVSTGGNINSIGLALFAYEPNPATTQQVSRSSGVNDVAVYMRQPTYKKYFTKISDKYLLSPEGKLWIIEEVIPELRKKKTEVQRAKEQ